MGRTFSPDTLLVILFRSVLVRIVVGRVVVFGLRELVGLSGGVV